MNVSDEWSHSLCPEMAWYFHLHNIIKLCSGINDNNNNYYFTKWVTHTKVEKRATLQDLNKTNTSTQKKKTSNNKLSSEVIKHRTWELKFDIRASGGKKYLANRDVPHLEASNSYRRAATVARVSLTLRQAWCSTAAHHAARQWAWFYYS